MYISKSFIPILKNNPSEAKIKSHQLMLRVGMIKQSSAGIYSWLPLGFKVIKKIEKIVSSLEKKRKIKGIRLMPSIESALGVVNCYEIASSSKRIDALVFGIFDLLNDMGIEYTKGNPPGAKYSRYNVPVAATAAGVVAIDGIWQDLKDNSGFVKDCQVGRSLGYSGKSVIHPDQIKTVHKIFHPSKPEIAWAKKVCSVYKKSTKKGKGATVVDGKMIDEVHYKRAKALLEI